MKPFNSCCLCCKLETGAYILGGLGLFACILNIVLGSLVLERVIYAEVAGATIIYQIVWCVIGLVIYAMLIAGTKKRNSCLLIPFLAFEMVGIIINVLAGIIFLTKMPQEELAVSITAVVLLAIGLALATYLWLCVYSLYVKIKNENYADSYKGFTV